MKVSELTGAQLNYWVAIAQGMEFKNDGENSFFVGPYIDSYIHVDDWNPSTNANQGVPIIDRERPYLCPDDLDGTSGWYCSFSRRKGSGLVVMHGESLLVAAMRAYVASNFGYEVPDSVETKQEAA